MRRIFRVMAPLVAASLIAGCAGGGTPAAVPANAGATSTSTSRSALDYGFGFGQPKKLSATPASLTFASPTAPAQTETIQQPNGFFGLNLRGAKVVVSPANLVTVKPAQACTSDGKHRWNGFFWSFWNGFFWNLWDGNDRNGRDCDDHSTQTLVYSVAPQTAGTGTITFSTGDGDNDGDDASVVVPVTVTAPAPPTGPLTVTVTPAGNLINCLGSLTAPSCPGTSLPLLNAVAGTPQLPQFTLAITESNYTGVFTVTDTDTSCGIAPATSRTPTTAGSETVQIALTQAGFSTIQAIRATPPLTAASCNVVVADDHGGSQTVTLSWQLGSTTLSGVGGV
jgi:hypothetical protein